MHESKEKLVAYSVRLPESTIANIKEIVEHYKADAEANDKVSSVSQAVVISEALKPYFKKFKSKK